LLWFASCFGNFGLSSESSWIAFLPFYLQEIAGLSLDLLGSWELPEMWLTAADSFGNSVTVPFSLCQVIAI
jgi:hypothetical protein